jgi:hypothetical protein
MARANTPFDYALRQAFKNVYGTLQKEELRQLQMAIVHWDYCPKLPRYGPHSTWDDLDAGEVAPRRPLTTEEKTDIINIAFQHLPPESFLSLKSKKKSCSSGAAPGQPRFGRKFEHRQPGQDRNHEQPSHEQVNH